MDSTGKECNNCLNHIQGDVPPKCRECLSGSFYHNEIECFLHWEPKRKEVAVIAQGYIDRDVGLVSAKDKAIKELLKDKLEISALNTQVGGDHYKNMKIQPIEYSMANNLDACQHTIVKYVSRFRDKGGIKDLEKARHTLELLIEFELAK